MKLSNIILFIGSIIVAFFAYKWYVTKDSSYEPWVTFLSTLLTAVAYYFSWQNEKNNGNGNNTTNIKGNDNIVIKNSDKNRINIK